MNKLKTEQIMFLAQVSILQGLQRAPFWRIRLYIRAFKLKNQAERDLFNKFIRTLRKDFGKKYTPTKSVPTKSAIQNNISRN